MTGGQIQFDRGRHMARYFVLFRRSWFLNPFVDPINNESMNSMDLIYRLSMTILHACVCIYIYCFPCIQVSKDLLRRYLTPKIIPQALPGYLDSWGFYTVDHLSNTASLWLSMNVHPRVIFSLRSSSAVVWMFQSKPLTHGPWHTYGPQRWNLRLRSKKFQRLHPPLWSAEVVRPVSEPWGSQ